jgi:CSLREA domain-containing protein
MNRLGSMCRNAMRFALMMSLMLSLDVGATMITVGTTTDVFSSGASGCSLRAALYAVSSHTAFGGCPAGNGSDTILVPPGTYAIALSPVSGHPEQGGAFYIGSHTNDVLAIAGTSGPATTILDGSGIDTVLNILPGATSTTIVTGFTIRGGTVASGLCSVAGVSFGCSHNVPDARFNFFDSWITANDGTGFRAETGIIALQRIAVTDNVNTGVVMIGTGASTFDDVTVSRNVGRSSYEGPGGVLISNTVDALTINNTTIAYNTFGDFNSANYTPYSTGGIAIIGATMPTVYVRNTLIANNARGDRAAGADCKGLLQSQGHNLIGDPTGCAIAGVTTGNLLGVNPQLAPLFDYGRGIPTHLLLPGSPAIGAGNPATPGSSGAACARYDIRNFDRTSAGNGTCDIGAYQTHTDYLIDTTIDANDNNHGDGHCDTGTGACSLRAAITEANFASTFKTIVLPAGHFSITLAPEYMFFYDNFTGTFSLQNHNAVTIIGAGANKTIIDGNGMDRVFTIATSGGGEPTVSFHNATLTGGDDNYFETGGGGILAYGNLLLDRVVVSNNLAPTGGGVQIGSHSTLTVDSSSIIGNSANNGSAAFGGGILAGTDTTIDLTNSTIAQNSSAGSGGGISIVAGSQVFLSFDTITGNHALLGGGGIGNYLGGTFFASASIIANNTDASAQGPDCQASLQAEEAIVVRDANGCTIGGLAVSKVVSNVNPQLTGLANQGGPTPTYGTTASSVAHTMLQKPYDCIDNEMMQVLNDQRGVLRPTTNYGLASSNYCDVGAFQGVSDVIFADGLQ